MILKCGILDPQDQHMKEVKKAFVVYLRNERGIHAIHGAR